MSYQQYRPTGEVHRLTEFVPTYVPHSDYLPSNRVVDNQPQAQQWVPFCLFSFLTTRDRNSWERCIPPNLPSSTPADMFRSVPTKMCWSGNPSARSNSTAESGECDLISTFIPLRLHHFGPETFSSFFSFSEIDPLIR